MNAVVFPIEGVEIARRIAEAVNMAASPAALPPEQPDAAIPVSPAERQALRDICAVADLLNLPEGAFLLVPASPALLDVLAAFEADHEDMEDNADREAVNEDGGDVQDEPHDGELDLFEGESDEDREHDYGCTIRGGAGA